RLSALQAVATEVLSPKGLVRHRPAPLRLAFFGAKEASVRSLGAYEALSSKAKAQAIVPAENKRIPKRSALDPRIKKAWQSSAIRSGLPGLRASQRLCNTDQGSSQTESLPPKPSRQGRARHALCPRDKQPIYKQYVVL